MGWCPAPEYSEALEAYDSYYVIVSLPQWTKGYSLESSFITQVGFKFSSNMKVIIMIKFILSMMAKSSHSLYTVINRESDTHSLTLCDKRHGQIEFWNGGLYEQQHTGYLVT